MAEKKTPDKQKKPSALKRDLQGEKRRIRNKIYRSQVNTAVKNLRQSIAEKKGEESRLQLNHVYSLIDKGVKKGIVTKNRADRTKSRLASKTTP